MIVSTLVAVAARVLTLRVAVLVGGSVAGSVAATTGVLTSPATAPAALAVLAEPAPDGLLYPVPAGGYPSSDAGAVVTRIENRGGGDLRVTTVTAGTVTVTPLPGRTCAPGSVVTTSAAPLVLPQPIDVPAGGRSVSVTLPGFLTMLATAEDGCQDAAISVELTFGGAPLEG